MTPDQLLLVGGAALGGALWLTRNRNQNIAEPILPPVGKRGPISNTLFPMREPLRIGNTKCDFYEQHLALRAMSGGYKTTLQAQILRERLKAGRSCVVLTGGDSDQLETEVRAWGGWIIRPHESPLTFNAFEGADTFMAQAWAELFPTTSEAKVYHSAFEIACIRYFQTHSRYSVRGLMDFILTYDPDKDPKQMVQSESGERLPKLDGKLWKGMREGYVGIRLQLMDLAFGDWIGDQLSILDCAKQGIPIMFVLDSSNDPDLNRFACALVWQAINYAIRERGNLDVFVDELGRLPPTLVGDQVRTWRRNKSHLIVGSHKDSDFTEVLNDLIHIQLLGTMVASAEKTRQGAQAKTWNTVHSTNFGTHAMQPTYTVFHKLLRRPHKGRFWMVNQERVERITVTEYHPPKKVKPRWSMRGYLNATGKHPPTGGSPATKKSGASTAFRLVSEHPGSLIPVSPGSDAPEIRIVGDLPEWCREEWLAAMWRESRFTHTTAILWCPGREVWFDEEGCREWQGGFIRRGTPWRPRKWVAGHGDVTPYREFVRAAGQDPDPTCDHWCDNPACVKVEHIEGGVSFRDNQMRTPVRKAAFELAGWHLISVGHFDSCPVNCEYEHVRWRERVAERLEVRA